MRFGEFDYKRPDMKSLGERFEEKLDRLVNAEGAEEQNRAIEEINLLRREFESMSQICYIRHTIDTKDSYYENEQNFFDENEPVYEGLISKYYKAILGSSFKEDLKDRWGAQLFRLAEKSVKVFSEEIVEDLIEENRLATRYTKVLASAQIEFGGRKRTLSEMKPFQMDSDRRVRKAANDAKYAFMCGNGDDFDDIFDKLVKVRTRMARRLGYDNFVQMGYDRMQRTDYDAEMVASYRESIRRHITPLAVKIKERQRKRLGIEKLFNYDEQIFYMGGNAKPIGDHDFLVEKAREMYRDLSKETGDFFDFMIENELMSLRSLPGKSPGGYCTYISKYSSPFIFSNFNGTTDDVDVLTHEAGHAFQTYMSRKYLLLEYNFPTLEACEIHSMSMEFLTWPWMENFFGDDADKYRYGHLSHALMFIPYGAAVDEFQHTVYEKPDASPSERRRMWRETEMKYLPYLDYGDNDYLNSGGFWHQQGHIFKNPFYYIDYTLAQVCAFQFWLNAEKSRQEAWAAYAGLCGLGGSRSFLELVEAAGLESPFKEEVFESVAGHIDDWLGNAVFDFL
ncbi:MAG: M3 family oligoendopeptidase [Clostridiales bacterium]|nr:MAG: M3 family oligoendopeptidase [Clostridiales bacterium]